MADIRNYIEQTLLDPLQYYPTEIQHTMLELITEMLETLYDYTVAFPEIVSPNSTRLDILKVIADQFLFTIRDDAKLQEQIDILKNILEVYNKRGSIDTIENMWKYYGGDLPKEVEVIIPSYNIFKYNVSSYSGSHVYQDSTSNRSGVYEIKLTNSDYPIPELKEFLIKELVAAGNFIYFSNNVLLDMREGFTENGFNYLIYKDDLLDIQMQVAPIYQGMTLSGPTSVPLSGAYNLLENPDINTVWSGKENIFIDITNIVETESEFVYKPDLSGFNLRLDPCFNIISEKEYINMQELSLHIYESLHCTSTENSLLVNHDLYNDRGEHVTPKYFMLGESLLGESLGYELV